MSQETFQWIAIVLLILILLSVLFGAVWRRP